MCGCTQPSILRALRGQLDPLGLGLCINGFDSLSITGRRDALQLPDGASCRLASETFYGRQPRVTQDKNDLIMKASFQPY